jgi:hypothetical protein
MLISLTLKRKPQEPWGWVLWKGELAASEPPVFITAGIVQLEHQLTYFCLENMAFMPPGQFQLRVTPISRIYLQKSSFHQPHNCETINHYRNSNQ